jgi:hypothetical protein
MKSDPGLAPHLDRVRGLASRLEFARDVKWKEELRGQLRNARAAIKRSGTLKSELVAPARSQAGATPR